MGKKFKAGKMRNIPEERSDKPEQIVPKSETGGHMGISKNSKKIKKQKKQENVVKIIDVVSKTEALVEQAVKKKKNKKHKTPPTDKVTAEGEPGVGNGTEALVLKKSKKEKRKGSEVKPEICEDKPKKKHKKNKVSVECEPEVCADGNGIEVVLKKSKKEKRKAPEVESEANVDKPKKHKKKNKHNNHPNGGEVESQSSPSVKNPETKSKHKTQKVKVIEADKDVVTSESESEDEPNDVCNEMDQVNQSILNQHSNADEEEFSGDELANKKAKDKEVKEGKKEKRFTGPEHSIFIGNLPITAKKSTMKSMFKQYGQILTIRFRTNDGVSLFKKKDRKEAKALNCYIRFETRKEAEAACSMNGQLVEGNRIRVTMHTQKQMGHAASTVFVGNINRKTTDNELYDFFSRVGEIEYVRQIADKGIGYVCFKKGVSIAKALKLNQQLLSGRPLRIVKVDPTKQGKRKNKKGNLVDKAKSSHPGGTAKQPANEKNQRHDGQKQKPPVREFHGAVAKTKSGNKYKLKKKGGPDKKKKLLAQKLTAAGASRNK